jgi:hypothetical protein
VRIAFSGTHRSGKSTLVEQLSTLLPRYSALEEPYALLEEEGYESADPPSIDDFQAQLERSLAALENGEQDVLFDRCPADILAYLFTHDDAAAFDADEWLDRIAAALKTLDLVVFVPIEDSDRIPVAAHDDRVQRLAVHEKLEEMFTDELFGWSVDVLRVEGDAQQRAQQVIAKIRART